MASRRPAKGQKREQQSWRVVRIKSTPASDLGVVQAGTKEGAIQKACEQYNITDAFQRSRLMAQRVG